MQASCDSDDALIARFLGSRYLGRRYLRYSELEALGIVDDRSTLVSWMRAGGFPRSLKIPSRYGKTLVWDALEVAQHIAQRVAARDLSPLENEAGAPAMGRPPDSKTGPLATGRNEFTAPCPYPKT
jgi:predicted DNA-binding transcriptional regulator AlpA